jgi:hypothetical protein
VALPTRVHVEGLDPTVMMLEVWIVKMWGNVGYS